MDGSTNEKDAADMFSDEYRLSLVDSDFEAHNSDTFTASITSPDKTRIHYLDSTEEQYIY